MKPGQQVAFLSNGMIEIGILAAIINRKSITGDTTQFVVTSIGPDSTANADRTITNEEHIIDFEGWNADARLFKLAQETEQFKWSYTQTHAEPETPPPAPPVAVELPALASPGSGDF